MDLMRWMMFTVTICVPLALGGCADHPAMPQPSGPLRTMNPGLWNYHGNDVVPQPSSPTR
ncbi:MAG TPA: hypothetical protein VMU81_26950 [Acetobacteraceae bacterium]|nr:hypothetical protein [Acetobacteraceae bacterium]